MANTVWRVTVLGVFALPGLGLVAIGFDGPTATFAAVMFWVILVAFVLQLIAILSGPRRR